MKARKILTTIILLFVAIFSFCGCASLQMVRAVDSSGTIIDRLVIELDESKINKSGKTMTEVKSAIKNDIISFRQYVASWKTQFSVEEFPELSASISNGITINDTDTGNQLSVAIEFSNWQMFGLFYGIVDLKDAEYQKALNDVGPFLSQLLLGQYETTDMAIFLYKYSHIEDAGFIKNLQALPEGEDNDFSVLYEKYKKMTNNYYDIADLEVSQVFAYPDAKIYSNADEIGYEGDLTMMMWDLSGKEDGFKMEIYKLGPKATDWYVLALIISAVAVIVIIFKLSTNAAKNKVAVHITKEEVEKDEK